LNEITFEEFNPMKRENDINKKYENPEVVTVFHSLKILAVANFVLRK